MKTKEEVFEYFDAHGFNRMIGFDLGCDVAMSSVNDPQEESEKKHSLYVESARAYAENNNISRKDLDEFYAEYGEAIVK